MADPKLKEAMEEIKEILRHYDIAGFIELQSATDGEFLYRLNPSWSCASLNEKGEFRFKAAAATGGPVEKERARVTAGLICGMFDMAAKHLDDSTKMMVMIKQHMEIDHTSTFER